VKLQLGEFVDTQVEPGLYFKVPLLQNVKFYDKGEPHARQPEPTA
jgi:regulator of protease activity HflC (stomatin/prohibitin superfamily)